MTCENKILINRAKKIMSDLTYILLLTALGSILSLTGGVIFLAVKQWSQALAKYSIPFAAGVLLTVSLLGLLPEASHMVGDNAFLIVLLSFLGAYLFETLFFDLHHHHDDGHHQHTSSVPLVIIGDTIHNFIDGVTIAAAYLVNPGLGLATAISTFLHEVPHEIGDFGILLKSGFSNKRVFLVNFVSSLSAFVGALVVFFLASGDQFIGTLLAVSAGLFLYLGASDFLPKVSKQAEKIKSVAVVIAGIVIMYGALSLIPHSHDLEHADGHHEEHGTEEIHEDDHHEDSELEEAHID
jgi:zinc and cadmium transporter